MKKSKAPKILKSEKEIVKRLLGNFIAEGSVGENLIEEICKCSIKQIRLKDLISTSIIVGQMAKIELPRNYKRSKKLLVKWYDENASEIREIKSCITCVYADEK